MRTLPDKSILRGVPFIEASLPASCVPACLAMVCSYLRPGVRELSIGAFARRLRCAENNGVHFRDAVEDVRQQGFRAREVAASQASRRAKNQVHYSLGVLTVPLIAGIDGGRGAHAVVITGYDGDDLLLRDPGGAWQGTTMRWRWPQFEAAWQSGRPVVWIANGPIESPF